MVSANRCDLYIKRPEGDKKTRQNVPKTLSRPHEQSLSFLFAPQQSTISHNIFILKCAVTSLLFLSPGVCVAARSFPRGSFNKSGARVKRNLFPVWGWRLLAACERESERRRCMHQIHIVSGNCCSAGDAPVAYFPNNARRRT